MSRGWERFILYEVEIKRIEVYFLKGVRYKSYGKLRNIVYYDVREEVCVVGILCVFKFVFEKMNFNWFIGGW